MIKLTKKQARELKKVVQKHCRGVHIPKVNEWKNMNNDKIWRHFVEEMIVIGGAKPADTLRDNRELQRRISYEKLRKLDDNRKKRVINSALRKIGCRYASKAIEKCWKTNALVNHFKILKYKGGPKGFCKTLGELDGLNRESLRIALVKKELPRYGNKAARDLLMGLGLVRQAIAFDARIDDILENKIGLRLPKHYQQKTKEYEALEKLLIKEVCEPLKIKGVCLDRILFQKHDAITA